MSLPGSGAVSDSRLAAADRLEGWKEIAAHLKRDVRTVQRWEKAEGLPVHRHLHAKRAAPYAFKGKLDSWRLARSDLQTQLDHRDQEALRRRRTFLKIAPWVFAGASLVAAATAAISLARRSPTSPARTLALQARDPAPRLANPVQVAAFTGAEGYPSWSPDGRLLAYCSDPSGNAIDSLWAAMSPPRPRNQPSENSDIWVMHITGGPPVNRTADHPGRDCVPSWSPDGRQIAFWSNREGGGIFVMSALSGGARKIVPSDLTGGNPAWSPDGSEFAYVVTDAGRFWLERRTLRDGATRRVLLPGTGTWRWDLTWSPDSRYIAYVDAGFYKSEVSRLWILRLSDGHGSGITDGRTGDWSPSWSPDSRTLFFVSNRDGTMPGRTMDVWRQPITSGGAPNGTAQRLTTGLELLEATISPDGRRLAYTKGRRVANVWRVPILTDRMATWADAQQLTFDRALVTELDISRDGQQLMICSDRSGNFDLWILPAGGGELQQFTTNPTTDATPAWSPDGREVAFNRYRTGKEEIWIQPIGGGPARQLTQTDAGPAYARWSADGKRIAFNAYRGVTSDIWVVPSTGGEPHQVSPREPTLNDLPDWSPDGRWLVFVSDRSGQNRLWRVPASGGPIEPVTTGVGSLPRWAPDGRILFARGEHLGEGANVWSVSPDEKAEHPLTNFAGKPGGSSYLATDGRFVYFSWLESLAADIWVMDVVPAGQ